MPQVGAAKEISDTYVADSKRQKFNILLSQLRGERASFLPHWRDLGDYILPRRPRFEVTDVNRGDRRNQRIIDSTATLAARTLRSGMMSGVTSPARPWFRLTTPDPDLAEFGTVKEWLAKVTDRMRTAFLRSNLYNALPTVYGDMGVFSTSAVYQEEDFENVTRFQCLPIGSYMIGTDSFGRVNVLAREFQMTVRQLVEKFAQMKNGKIDWSNFSSATKNAWESGHKENWVQVTHIIAPNEAYDPNKLSSKFKRFTSCYYEATTGANTTDGEIFLREAGYDNFPVHVPRWEVTGEDSYGSDCPGMSALGDIKALQLMHKRKAQAVEKMVNPPLVGPEKLRTIKTTLLPGDVNYIDEREGTKGLRPLHEVRPEIQGLLLDIQDHQQRIKRAFFEDLFLMLAQSDRREITAREIDERHEEKLLALGPVLEQLNQDLLDPLVDNTFDILLRQGQLPEPPEELQGMKLKVEYISVMAQAQKLIGIAGIERFTGFVGQVAEADPNVLDKVDTDQLIDEYSELTSIPPGIVRSDDKVQEIRQAKADAQKQAAAAEALKAGAGAAKDLSQTSLEGDTALKRIIDQANAGALAPTQ